MAQRAARIVTTDDVLHGEPRIEGRRIAVRHVAEWVEGEGLTAQAVAERYDLAVADVYAALVYYHEHPKQMSELERRDRERVREAEERGVQSLDDLRGESGQ